MKSVFVLALEKLHKTESAHFKKVGTIKTKYHLYDHLQVLIHCRPAQPAHPCQLADVHLACSVRWIVLEKYCGDIILSGLPFLFFGME